MDFERSYFDGIYGGDYDRRNPRWKTRTVLDALRRHRASGRLLDVGCAYGAFLAEAARGGDFALHGTDVSEHALEVAGQRLGPDVSLRVGGLFEHGFDGAFDVVSLLDVIEHIEDRPAAFAELRGLLAPGGTLLLTVPVYDGPIGWLVDRLDKDPTHVHRVARQEWLDLCEEQGFEVLEWTGLWRYFLARRLYVHVASRLTRRQAPAVLIVARARAGGAA